MSQRFFSRRNACQAGTSHEVVDARTGRVVLETLSGARACETARALNALSGGRAMEMVESLRVGG